MDEKQRIRKILNTWAYDHKISGDDMVWMCAMIEKVVELKEMVLELKQRNEDLKEWIPE